MVYNLKYDEEQHILIYTSTTVRSQDEIKGLIRGILESTTKHNCYNLLCDTREVKTVSNISNFIDLAKYQDTIPEVKRIKTALVHNEIEEIAKNYSFFADLCKMAGYKIKCFTDMDEAFTWLKDNNNNSTSSQFHFPV